MKKLLIITLMVAAVYCAGTRPVHADSRLRLEISAVQTGTATSAGDEYVKIYNPNTAPVDITGWKLQYRSASGTGDAAWTTRAVFACQPSCGIVAAQAEVVAASYDTPGKAFGLTGGMSSAGGQLQLVSPEGGEDLVGYGTAVTAEGGHPAPAPASGETIARRADPRTGLFVDTDDNADDFMLTGQADTPAPGGQSGGQVEAPASYLELLITELLPDPASPLTDGSNEFVELYNPNSEAVDAKGYTLEAGGSWRYAYTLPAMVVGPGAYVALYSSQTKLTLSNSGTAVRLLDPDGRQLDEVASYGVAKTGQGWAADGQGAWQWTTTPTPGAANILTVPVAAEKVPSAKPAAAKTVGKTTAAKKTTAKAAKMTVPKSKTVASAAGSVAPGSVKPPSDSPNYWLVGGLVAAALGYALYEYRNDIACKLRRLARVAGADRQPALPDAAPKENLLE